MVLDLHAFKNAAAQFCVFSKIGPFHVSSLASDHTNGRLGAIELRNIWVHMAEELKGPGLEC